jgi:hypothetical protein
MLGYDRAFSAKELRHLVLGKPDRLRFQMDFDAGSTVRGLINDYLIPHALSHWKIMGIMMLIFCNCPLVQFFMIQYIPCDQ